jgi:hypothetical protein
MRTQAESMSPIMVHKHYIDGARSCLIFSSYPLRIASESSFNFTFWSGDADELFSFRLQSFKSLESHALGCAHVLHDQLKRRVRQVR